MGTTDVTARLRVDGREGFSSDLHAAERDVDSLSGSNERSAKSSNLAAKANDVHSQSLKDLGSAFAATGSASLKGLGLIALAGSAASAVSGLVPLTGSLAAIPAALVGISSAAAGAKLAFSGLGAAVSALGDPTTSVKDLQSALQGLSPIAVQLAGQLAGIQAQGATLRGNIQSGFFPGLSAGISAAEPALLPLANRATTGIGSALGTGARNLGTTLATPAVRKDLGALVGGNNKALATLATGVAPATRALASLVAQLGPVEVDLARGAVSAARFLDSFTSSHTKGITSFISGGLHDAGDLFHVVGDLGKSLLTIFGDSAGTTYGNPFDAAAKGADQLVAFVQSPQGAKAITTFFSDARQISHDLGTDLGDAARASGPLVQAVGTLVGGADLVLKGFGGLPKVFQQASVEALGLLAIYKKLKVGGLVTALKGKTSTGASSGLTATASSEFGVRVFVTNFPPGFGTGRGGVPPVVPTGPGAAGTAEGTAESDVAAGAAGLGARALLSRAASGAAEFVGKKALPAAGILIVGSQAKGLLDNTSVAKQHPLVKRFGDIAADTGIGAATGGKLAGPPGAAVGAAGGLLYGLVKTGEGAPLPTSQKAALDAYEKAHPAFAQHERLHAENYATLYQHYQQAVAAAATPTSQDALAGHKGVFDLGSATTVTIAPGAIVVNGSTDPKSTAKAVVAEINRRAS